jgi:amino acid permease
MLKDKALMYRRIIMCTTTIVILYPLMMLKKMDSLRFTSMIAIGCIIYLVAIIIGKSMSNTLAVGFQDNISWVNFSPKVFIVLPIISFAYTFHMNIFPIVKEMKEPERINSVILSSVTICTIAYILVGLCGYLTFYEDVNGNILTNFTSDNHNDIFVEIGRVALALIICFSYPILGYTAR